MPPVQPDNNGDWQEVEITGRVPQFAYSRSRALHRFDEAFVEEFNDITQEPPEPYTPQPDQVKNDKEMLDAAKPIYNRIADAENNRQPVQGGRREREYINSEISAARNNMTGEELLDTDFPIALINLPQRQFRSLRNTGCRDIIPDPTSHQRYGWKCHRCNVRPPLKYTFLLDGSFWCAVHLPDLEMCTRCSEMQEGCVVIPQFDGADALLCPNCQGATECNSCGNRITLDRIGLGLCDPCLNRQHTGTQRPFSLSLNWVGGKQGDIVKSERIFSCEIETAVPSTSALVAVSKELPREAGMGHDGSIQMDYGFEIQSPRLGSALGEEFITRTTEVLHKYKARIDDSCGMHIHLDGRGIISPSRRTFPAALLQLWKAHLVFEDVTLSFLPYSRRRNDFCRPMADSFKLLELNNIGSLLDAEKLWYKERTFERVRRVKTVHRHVSRYFGVNLHSLLSHGHLEIRYHSGTTNPQKILEWANLHCLIMDAAAAGKFSYDFLREAQATSSLKEKTQMLFTLIGLSKESQHYYRSRQQKFMDKKQVETNTQKN